MTAFHASGGGSLADHEALCRAWSRHLLAEAAYDDNLCAETEKAATDAYIAMVDAAARVDRMSLRSDSVSAWIAHRVEQFRETFGSAS